MNRHPMTYRNPQRRERILNLAEHRRPKMPGDCTSTVSNGSELQVAEASVEPQNPDAAQDQPAAM